MHRWSKKATPLAEKLLAMRAIFLFAARGAGAWQPGQVEVEGTTAPDPTSPLSAFGRTQVTVWWKRPRMRRSADFGNSWRQDEADERSDKEINVATGRGWRRTPVEEAIVEQPEA